MKRYLAGLLAAFATFTLTFALVMVAVMSWPQQDIGGLVGIAMLFAAVNALALGLVVGPLVLLVRSVRGGRLPAVPAALLGAALSPVCLLAAVPILGDGDTMAGTLAFWRNVPLEFMAGVIPHAAASALFAVWLVRDTPRRYVLTLPENP